MKSDRISRRDTLRLVKLGALMSAGLGMTKLVSAETGESVLVGGAEMGDNTFTVSPALARKFGKLGIKKNGYALLTIKFDGTEMTGLHAIPVEGDLMAASKSENARVSWKIEESGMKIVYSQFEGKLGNFEIQD